MASKKPHLCPECGQPVDQSAARGKARVFCSDAHKQAHANRMTVRGKQLAKIALGWRKTRGSGLLGKFLFQEMTAMLDQWNSEDYAAGRMKADDYAALVTEFAESTFYPRGYTAKTHFDRRPS